LETLFKITSRKWGQHSSRQSERGQPFSVHEENALTAGEKVLRRIEKMSENQFLAIVGPEKGQVLAWVVRDTKPKRLLEVGTLIGYSTIIIGRELNAEAHLITIEIHPDEAKVARQNISEAGILAKVDVLVGDATKIIPTLKGPFDLVFIDAAKTEYYQYLKLVEGKLHTGSVIIADNAGVFADQMKDYLTYLRTSAHYRSKYVKVGEDGLEISIRS
jgi:predicted O-methyltransferase YrrM